MESILSLIQFAKKKKWLCPWGAELVDETHRLSNMLPPVGFGPNEGHPRSQWSLTATGINGGDLSAEDILDLLSDERQQWDRIIFHEFDPQFLEHLHLHPCEELLFSLEFTLRHERSDFENIAKCKTLRLIDLHFNEYDLEDMRLLERLPNLEKLVSNLGAHAMTCFNALKHFPHLAMLQMNASNHTNINYPSFPFQPVELTDALSYISDRKDTIHHLYITITVGSVVLATLGSLKNVESIFVEDMSAISYTGFDLYLLFMSPNLQKSVRHLQFNCTKFDKNALSHLAKFTNLRSIDFRGLGISTRHMCRIIEANADNLQSLSLFGCCRIKDALLDSISRCKSLRSIDILETGVTAEAIEKYKEAKRPFWQVLTYSASEYTSLLWATGKDSSDEGAEDGSVPEEVQEG